LLKLAIAPVNDTHAAEDVVQDNYPNVQTISIEPQWLRAANATPVASLCGMGFANPSLTADAYRPLTYFSSLPMGDREQGKEMSLFQKTLLRSPFRNNLP
jgi:hypothetical protein